VTDKSASASVEVGADPQTAFKIFTDEIDCWWVRGPINFFDASRAVAMRIEPGVGGRVLEVYDDASGDALELARITVWEPGERLVYRGTVDDTEVDVRVEAAANGTRVHVRQYLVEGGDPERAFLFWPRVIGMYRSWCGDRDRVTRQPREASRLNVAVCYRDPAAAARWLARVFGLTSRSGLPEEGQQPSWIELHVGTGAVLLFRVEDQPTADASPTHMLWVYVDDLDAHFAHAKANGATIVSEIHQHGYRGYVAEDLDGHRWTFAQAPPAARGRAKRGSRIKRPACS
jgi:uncharacterized glyoxalase superfamily protein PhnB